MEIDCIMWGKFYVLLYIIIIGRGPISVTYRLKGRDAGASFQLFLEDQIFLNFSMPLHY